MRSLSTLIIFFLAVNMFAPKCIAADAVAHTTAAQTNLVSTASPTVVTGKHHWSTRKKVITSIVVGAVLATAIAVPIACGVHHHEVELRRQRRLRALTEQIVRNQQSVVMQEQQQIQALLANGPSLMPLQRMTLQNDLAQVQREAVGLNQTMSALQAHRPLSAALLLDQAAVGSPAADEVSASTAALFSSFGQQSQALSSQAAMFHQQFVNALNGAAGAYGN